MGDSTCGTQQADDRSHSCLGQGGTAQSSALQMYCVSNLSRAPGSSAAQARAGAYKIREQLGHINSLLYFCQGLCHAAEMLRQGAQHFHDGGHCIPNCAAQWRGREGVGMAAAAATAGDGQLCWKVGSLLT